MEKEIVKQGYEEAQKILKEKQIEEVKRIVTKTLEKIEIVDSKIEAKKQELKELEEEKKLLKMDIDDLKEGRLDRIQERQEKDPKAKNTSIVIIFRERTVPSYPQPITIDRNPWYDPYKVTWYCNTSDNSCINSTSVNGSVAKYATPGTYVLTNKVVNLR